MAEPKPAVDKPNLVAVTPEPKPDEKQAAKPVEAASTRPAQAKSAPVGGKAAPTPAAAPQKKQGTRWGLWLLVLLVAIAAGTAWFQTQRLTQAEGKVTALSEQVLGLQAQVAAANLQIHTFEMQREQVREAVADLSNRVLLLNDLVGGPITPEPELEPVPAP